MYLTPCVQAHILSLCGAKGCYLAKFSVKFPVSREYGRSRVSSALRRQPASPGSRDFPYKIAGKPAVRGLLALEAESLRGEFDKSSVMFGVEFNF